MPSREADHVCGDRAARHHRGFGSTLQPPATRAASCHWTSIVQRGSAGASPARASGVSQVNVMRGAGDALQARCVRASQHEFDAEALEYPGDVGQ